MKDSNNQFCDNELLDETEEITLNKVETDPVLEGVSAPPEMKEKLFKQIEELAKQDEAYARLSEEDRKALELGRQMLKENQESAKAGNYGKKKKKRKKFSRVQKAVGSIAAAACLVLVIGGVTSIGGAQHFSELFEDFFQGRSRTKVVSDSKNVKVVGEDEEKAYQEIKDEFGFDPVRLYYKPDDTEFVGLTLDQEMQLAQIDYIIKGRVMSFKVFAIYRERSIAIDKEDKFINEYVLNLDKCEVNVKEYEISETGEKELNAQFVYKDKHYFLKGIIDKEEFDKILKGLYFF